MSKVIITREQEAAVELWKKTGYTFKSYVFCAGKWSDTFEPLNSIEPGDFSLILHGWYEVVEEVELNDWVMCVDDMRYFKVVNFDEIGASRALSLGYVRSNPQKFKKVTSELKCMFLNAGRFDKEFKVGDIIVTETFVYEIEDELDVNSAINDAEEGKIKKVCFVDNILTIGGSYND